MYSSHKAQIFLQNKSSMRQHTLHAQPNSAVGSLHRWIFKTRNKKNTVTHLESHSTRAQWVCPGTENSVILKRSTSTTTTYSSSNNIQDQCLIITDIYGVREKGVWLEKKEEKKRRRRRHNYTRRQEWSQEWSISRFVTSPFKEEVLSWVLNSYRGVGWGDFPDR